MFQGKERDIVLLSMVECPETRTSKTALPFQQRFNVALSRARDREYLFHSVTEEMLKPDDLKSKVLRHFKNSDGGPRALWRTIRWPCASPGSSATCSAPCWISDTASVLRSRSAHTPSTSSSRASDDRRLAIELDGDQYHGPERWAEDLARQRVMERVGWRFWRCWGSSYRLDPGGCIDELVRALRSLSIEPIGMAESETVWTEFRTYSPRTADTQRSAGRRRSAAEHHAATRRSRRQRSRPGRRNWRPGAGPDR